MHFKTQQRIISTFLCSLRHFVDSCEMREITEIFELKGRLTKRSPFGYSWVSDQQLLERKFAKFEICDMNVFLPIASCLLFSSSYNPLLFHPYPDLEMAYPFCFSDSFTCPGNTTRSPNLFYSHSFRLSQDHPAARFSFMSHHLSLNETNLLSCLSS